jgi:uncharacterized membrane protein (UPF0127 family)
MRTILFLLLATSCSSGYTVEQAKLIAPDGKESPVLTLEIADNHAKRQLGLMYRRGLEENSGMLFIFPEEVPRSFWMKNTFIELDMAFLDSNYRIVSIIRRAKPLTEKAQESGVPARYVLEVSGGSLEKWGIDKGATLKISGR